MCYKKTVWLIDQTAHISLTACPLFSVNHSAHCYKSRLTSGRWVICTCRDIMSSIGCHHDDSINRWINGRRQSAGRYRYIMGLEGCWDHVCSYSFRAVHLWLDTPLLGHISPVVLRDDWEKCRTSSAELSLHSCWCQLLCPPFLLSCSISFFGLF